AGRAAAADPVVQLSVVARPTGAPPAVAPTIEATLIGGSRAAADRITIAPADDPTAVVRAVRVRDYAHGDEPASIVLVIDGQEVWMGNASYEKDEAARVPGALAPLARALDGMRLAAALPRGSRAAIVTYAKGAAVKLPMGDPKRVTGRAL